MYVRRGVRADIRAVLDEADPDAPLMAREVFRLREKDGDAFGCAHRVPPTSV
jgi:hypothetical protein